jgi:Carbohydrate-binding family 9
MLAQHFDDIRAGRLARAQKVCGQPDFRAALFLVLSAYAAVVVVIDWARATGTRGSSWEHRLTPFQAQEHEMRADTATAMRFIGATDAQGLPMDSAWTIAPPVRFNADWQGWNPDPERETEVRVLWSPEKLYLRFDARYRELTVFPDAESTGRREHLWDRDVCEAFLQPDPSQPRRYKEFEVAPNGFWIDLDIGAGKNRDLHSGLIRRVDVDSAGKKWRAVLALPMKSIVERLDPSALWRANFYRVEGPTEPRFYSAWQPTKTAVPNFHVPEAFGRLVFAEGAAQ